MSLLDDPEIGRENSRDRCEEDAETSHERQQGRGRVDYFPRNHDPSGGHGGDDYAAADIDVLWEEGGHVVGAGDDVCGEVGTDLGDDPYWTLVEIVGDWIFDMEAYSKIPRRKRQRGQKVHPNEKPGRADPRHTAHILLLKQR
jgi:hypothetical protein